MTINRLSGGIASAMGNAGAALATAAREVAPMVHSRSGALREQIGKQLNNFQPARLSAALERFCAGAVQAQALHQNIVGLLRGQLPVLSQIGMAVGALDATCAIVRMLMEAAEKNSLALLDAQAVDSQKDEDDMHALPGESESGEVAQPDEGQAHLKPKAGHAAAPQEKA
ncbi:hypothetical protein [Pseudoduganella violacea]|uniref:Uncharacterized protein n=1 Tax=Pseudoduganella violacea TaxID=1715466 RepID=A0A7W5BEZ2_9BURK|nr:hypothetical protein [Pseudoduganella violacea]MBB3121947.1 hypothetical protein [Pseudoduganella violacea]